MVASRRFIEQAGLMDESYFLYYEEIDWARRRGALPLRIIPNALVCHKVGSAIGSGAGGRDAGPFSNYYNYRSRMRYMRRHHPIALPLAWCVALAKAVQLAIKADGKGALAIMAAICAMRPPPS